MHSLIGTASSESRPPARIAAARDFKDAEPCTRTPKRTEGSRSYWLAPMSSLSLSLSLSLSPTPLCLSLSSSEFCPNGGYMYCKCPKRRPGYALRVLYFGWENQRPPWVGVRNCLNRRSFTVSNRRSIKEPGFSLRDSCSHSTK
jgi:hypothetical protein